MTDIKEWWKLHVLDSNKKNISSMWGKWGFFGPIINTIKVVPNAQNGVNGAFLGPK